MFDWPLGLSYLSHKTGIELAMFGGFAVSTEDPATAYRNGDIFHLDEFLPTKHGFDEFFGNLYHLNAEEEP
jgi:arylsulfatase A-like enzyme